MPPPLQIPPSRARRQFAARLAQRKAMLEASAKEANETNIADNSTDRTDSGFENGHTSEQDQTLDEEQLQGNMKGGNDSANNRSSGEEAVLENHHEQDIKVSASHAAS